MKFVRFVLAALLLALCLPHTRVFAAGQPNILFILTDDMGWGDLGVFYQNSRNFTENRSRPAFATPNLDALASQGLQLRRHYCPAPVCAPSRASLLLGVHQGHAGVRDNQFDYPLDNNHTLATVLRQAGYSTACIGKYGLDGSALGARTAGPLLRGFDFFFGYLDHLDGHYHYPKEGGRALYDGTNNISAQLDKCYTTDLWTARAKKWIADHQATNAAQPYFMYLAYDTPHAQLQLPTQPFPGGAGTNGGLQWLGTPGAMINTASGPVDTWIHPAYTNATYDHDTNTSTAEVAWPDYAKRHATMMRRIDDAVGDLLQTLKDLNCESNTLVIFTSDNGPHNEAGSGGIYTYIPTFFDSFGPMDGIKRDSWEGGMREPTLARWPGHVAPGTTNFTASQFHDWLPSFSELAGVPAPARTDGVSLVPTLTGSGIQRPSTIYVEYEYSGTTPSYAEFEPWRRGATRNQEQVLYLDGYKGIRYDVTANSNNFRIYDTLNDAKEVADLAASSAYFTNLQSRMKDRILQMRRPLATAPRPYDSDLVPPVSATTVAGLNWQAYEGVFPWVPDFTPIPTVATGSCSGLDLSVRTRSDNIGLLYTGYLRAPSDGAYTFYLTTDGRAFFRLHEASLLDADFGYTNGTECTASINLKTGLHPFRLAYSRGGGGAPSLSLQWSGPGFAKQSVPPGALVRDGSPSPTPPTANPDSANTLRNTPVIIDVIANDTDDGTPGPLRIVAVTAPLAGSAVTNATGQIVYTPNLDFLGTDTFDYTISDGASTATARVTVAVGFFDGDYWFSFDELSGLQTTETGGWATATLVGFTNDPSQWVDGHSGRAIYFDGFANYVSVDNFSGILGAAARTCAAWVKTTSSGQLPVIAWGPNRAGNKWTFLVQTGNVRLEVTSGYLQGTHVLNDGHWHHIACTLTNTGAPNATDVRLFMDGVRETNFNASLSHAINTTASGNVKIGSDVQDRYFAGQIDDARIYARALSDSEITALARASNLCAVAWHRRYFGDDPINWAADDDNDGGNRLLEYAFGAEPWIRNRQALSIGGALVGDYLRVWFPRRLAATSELVYDVQVSRDLLAWNSLAATLVSATPIADKPGFELATFQTVASVAQENTQFVRVSIALP